MKKHDEDYSSQLVEDLKWFLFGDCEETIPNKVNSVGFENTLEFKSWCGDQHSFIVTDRGSDCAYRISMTKEE